MAKMSAILVASVIWTLVIPGSVAYMEGVFYEVTLPSSAVEQKRELQEFTNYRSTLEGIRGRLDAELGMVARGQSPQDPARLFTTREQVVRELREVSPPIATLPFFGNPSWCYWAAVYAGLGILGLLLVERPTRLFSKHSMVAGVSAYVAFASASWARNFAFGSHGRTIFSYVNHDIGPWSYSLQELRALGMCILLAIVWRSWNRRHASVVVEMNRSNVSEATLVQAVRHSSRIRDIFSNWQVASVCVVVAFLPWTYFYWQTATVFGDGRYYVSALVMHGLWAVTWICVSAPVLTAVTFWTRYRGVLLANSGGSEEVLRTLKELDPIGNVGAVGAVLGSVVSFVLPAFDLIKKVI